MKRLLIILIIFSNMLIAQKEPTKKHVLEYQSALQPVARCPRISGFNLHIQSEPGTSPRCVYTSTKATVKECYYDQKDDSSPVNLLITGKSHVHCPPHTIRGWLNQTEADKINFPQKFWAQSPLNPQIIKAILSDKFIIECSYRNGILSRDNLGELAGIKVCPTSININISNPLYGKVIKSHIEEAQDVQKLKDLAYSFAQAWHTGDPGAQRLLQQMVDTRNTKQG